MKSALVDRLKGWGMAVNHPVVAVGLGMIAVQIIFRGWASMNGWFYVDDFVFLSQSTKQDLSWAFLMAPYDFQLMPGGRLAAWLVAQAGPFNWTAASAILIAFQLLADLLCLALLCRMFGRRWWCLAPLGFYLFSTMTLTAFMWWAAAINQIPCQAACFAALLFHWSYLTTRRKRFAFATAFVIALGLCFYVKAVLIFGVLVLFTLLYATRGSVPFGRLRDLITRFWHAWVVYVPLGLAYSVYYAVTVPNPLASEQSIRYMDLLDTMMRVSLGTSLVGGPWTWENINPPVALVATPDWAVTAAWVSIALGCIYMLRSRRGDWKALVLAASYLAVSYVVTAQGRGFMGGFAGLELRYLADAAPVLTLCIGLFGMRPVTSLGDEVTSPAVERRSPSLVATAGILVALGLGAVISNVQYVRFWTGPFPAKTYTQNVQSESARERLRIVDEPVPGQVVASTTFPFNLPSRVFKPLGERVDAAISGTDLSMLNSSGRPFPAVVSGGAESLPGEQEGCGYRITTSATDVDFTAAPQSFFWWMQISYLAGDAGTLDVVVGDRREEHPVRRGIHRLLVSGQGPIDDVSMSTKAPGLGLCVDTVAVGNVSPLEPFE